MTTYTTDQSWMEEDAGKKGILEFTSSILGYDVLSIQNDAGQHWFWTETWQAMEAEADRDIAEGRVQRFDNVETFLDALDE